MKNALVDKFECRVPRYTSYPTALQFNSRINETQYGRWLGELDSSEPISLYIHVPFCREVCWYCACNMKLAARSGPVLDYTKHLKYELDLVADRLPQRMLVTALHWGGGTPTTIPIDGLSRVMDRLTSRFEISPNCEIAFELDPRTFETDMAGHLARLGTTRVSLGVQEFDSTVQKTVNRIQPFEIVARTVNAIRDAGVSQINFDLMYGLPYQTVETLINTIEKSISLAPGRIALFGYAHVPWMAKRQKQIPVQALPNAKERFEQAEAAAERLVSVGYQRIGLDHFALPDDKLARAAAAGKMIRNFQGYSAESASTLLGIGATSISTLPEGYVQNISETGAYMRAVSARKLPVSRGYALSSEDRLRRAVIESLMCNLEADVAEIANEFGRPRNYFGPELDRCRDYVSEGLVEIVGAKLKVEESGRPALRVIASVFDKYLGSNDNSKRHAAAI